MNFLHHLAIHTKINLILAFLLVFSAAITGFGLKEIYSLDAKIEEFITKEIPVFRSFAKLGDINLDLAIAFERTARHGSYVTNAVENASKITQHINEFKARTADLSTHLNIIEKSLIDTDTQGRKLSKNVYDQDILRSLSKVRSVYTSIGEDLEQMHTLYVNERYQEVLAVSEHVEVSFKEASQTLESLSNHSEGLMSSAFNTVKGETTAILGTILFIFTFMVVLSVPLARILIKSITTPMHTLIHNLRRAALSGDYSSRVPVLGSNELSQLGEIFNRMAQNAEDQAWLKSAATAISNILQSVRSPKEMSEQLLASFGDLLRCGFGIFYLVNEKNGQFERVGSYRFKDHAQQRTSFALGEGIVGQCAKEGRLMVMSDIPEGYFPVHSGLGEALPKKIMAIPFQFQDRVLAVMEVATFHDFNGIQKTLLAEQVPGVGMGLDNLLTGLKTTELLKKTVEQHEEMLLQSAKLKMSNEELEAQAESLRKTQEELQVQQDDLERINGMLELSRQDLQKKAEETARASQYKSQFLANMSHELRTPLNSLLILAREFAENVDGNLTNDQLESARVIHDSGSDLLSLINDILDMSKIEAGKMEPYLDTMNLAEFADDLKRRFQPLAQKKGLVWQTAIDKDVPEVLLCDRDMLLKIIRNFLSNAFKFTQKGGVFLVVSLSADHIFFKVQDSGIGIPQDKLTLIFDPFQQADGTTSRRFGGTGLGLSIAREMASLLGGKIQVNSEEGKGAEFSLVLPYSAQEQTEPKQISSPGFSHATKSSEAKVDLVTEPQTQVLSRGVPTPTSSGFYVQYKQDNPAKENTPKLSQAVPVIEDHPLKGGTVLIIEDDKKFVSLISSFIEESGFRCLVAETGGAGIELATKHLPLGIILDLGLPDMDGYAVLDQIKANPITAKIPVHIVSASDPDRERVLRKGGVGMLKKPVSKEDLFAIMVDFECSPYLGTASALLVEDDPHACKAIQSLLEKDGVDVVTVTSGVEAIQHLENRFFRCVILDLSLPDMDGFEFLRQIEKSSIIQAPPVIIHTGRDLTRDEYISLRQITDSVVSKGFVSSPQHLISEVRHFIEQVDLPRNGKQETQGLMPDVLGVVQGKTVLLVDDDMRNTFALSRALERKKIQVIMAPDGLTAINMLEKFADRVNLVLMDIMMPGIDGNETIRRIRQQQRFVELPVFALSAKAMQDDRKLSFAAGANEFLAKPVDVDQLLVIMAKWLTKNKIDSYDS